MNVTLTSNVMTACQTCGRRAWFAPDESWYVCGGCLEFEHNCTCTVGEAPDARVLAALRQSEFALDTALDPANLDDDMVKSALAAISALLKGSESDA